MRIWQDLTGSDPTMEVSRAKRGLRTNANQLSTMSGLHSLKFCGVTLEIPNKNLEVLRSVFQPCLITRGFPGPCHFLITAGVISASSRVSTTRLPDWAKILLLSSWAHLRRSGADGTWNPKPQSWGVFPRLGSVRNWKVLRCSWWMDVDGFSCTDIEKLYIYHMFDM